MIDEKVLKAIREAREKWEREVQRDLEKAPERKKAFTTMGGIPVKRAYTPEDLADRRLNYLEDIGFPGSYPYTRGIHPTMYRGRQWTIRQSWVLSLAPVSRRLCSQRS